MKEVLCVYRERVWICGRKRERAVYEREREVENDEAGESMV